MNSNLDPQTMDGALAHVESNEIDLYESVPQRLAFMLDVETWISDTIDLIIDNSTPTIDS